MASLDGSAAVDAWEDFEEYGTESRDAVAAEHFHQRWLTRASRETDWASFNETALGVLSLPPCDSSLNVFMDDDEVVEFWLHGGYLEILGDPDPSWRPLGRA